MATEDGHRGIRPRRFVSKPYTQRKKGRKAENSIEKTTVKLRAILENFVSPRN
jgi:hypothetical protein